MAKDKKNKVELVGMSENGIEIFCHLLYKLIGRKLMGIKKFNEFFYSRFYNVRYEGILKKANLKLIPEEYFLSIFITLVSIITLMFVLTTIYLFIVPVIAAAIFYGGLGLVAFLGIFLYNYPVLIAKDRGAQIDASIPYLLPYLKILAKELTLAKIMDIIVDFLIYKEIRNEFEKIRYYSSVIGYDIQTSVREAMQSCPSRQLADTMNDLVTISNSGGDIYSYLDRKLDNLEQEIDAIEKKNIETLLIYSQIYVVLLLIAPLFYTIMSTILNMVNLSPTGASSVASSGGDGTFFSILVLLLLLPFAYTGFMMLVFYSKPLYSRLKPYKNEER